MQDTTDVLLSRLATMPAPIALDALEAGVFAAIDEQVRSRRAGRRAGAMSVAAALAVGLVGGGLVGGADAAARASGPIGMDTTLAPSTLLLGR